MRFQWEQLQRVLKLAAAALDCLCVIGESVVLASSLALSLKATHSL
jgi:hypothetical protein